MRHCKPTIKLVRPTELTIGQIEAFKALLTSNYYSYSSLSDYDQLAFINAYYRIPRKLKKKLKAK